MTIGQKIKKLRIEKGLTQKDLADQVHVTFQTISKWESDINEPDISTLKEIAKLFGVTLDFLADENEELQIEKIEESKTIVNSAPQEIVNNTIIVQQKELHICAKCGEKIPEDDLVSENIYKRELKGKYTRSTNIGQTYYHSRCLALVREERSKIARANRMANRKRNIKKCFGWSIPVGVLSFLIALALFLINAVVHPGLGVLYSFLIGYAMFSMAYCIMSGSYIGVVFMACANFTIKFPGLIFSWSLDGIRWLISMKILFAVLGFLIGVASVIFATVLSAFLGSISFPFVLVLNNRNDYQNTI